jgi:hypothetical protein
MEGRAAHRSVASDGLLAEQILALSKTRVGGLDFSDATGTEPPTFLTDGEHQGSSAFSRELVSDLVGFLAEDPGALKIGSPENAYTYVGNSPFAVVDPDGAARKGANNGLQPCQKNPAFAGCGEPGSGCCVAKAIDDLRFSLCIRRQDQKAFKIIGTAVAFGVGFRLGLPLGLDAACGTGLAFGAAGYYGFFKSYYGYQWAAAAAGQQAEFSERMKGCGVECPPDKSCLVDNLFRQILAE